jgi:hypothetical protein
LFQENPIFGQSGVENLLVASQFQLVSNLIFSCAHRKVRVLLKSIAVHEYAAMGFSYAIVGNAAAEEL